MKNDYLEKASKIYNAYERGYLEESINVCSTGETCILYITKPIEINFILSENKTNAIKEMIELQEQGFIFDLQKDLLIAKEILSFPS